MGSKGGGGSSSTTTTVEKADPWEGQQPYLEQVFREAANLYNSGQLSVPYYPELTVAPTSEWTERAISDQITRAANGSPEQYAAQQLAEDVMRGDPSQNPFSDVNAAVQGAGLSGWNGNVNNGLGLTAWGGNDTSAAQSLLGEWENPAALNLTAWDADPNSYLDAMVQRAIGQTNAGVASNAAAAGRYGSGAFNAAAYDAAGNIAADMYGTAYDNDMNRSLSAWGTLQGNQLDAYKADAANSLAAWQAQQDNLYDYYNGDQNRNLSAWQTLQGNQLSAAENYANRDLTAWGQEQQNQLNAYNQAQQNALNAYTSGLEQQRAAMTLTPSLANMDYTNLAALSEAGVAQENRWQMYLDDAVNRWNSDNSAALTNLQNYMNIIQGNYGGTGTTTVDLDSGSSGRSNPLGGVASGALAGAGMGTSIMPGWGTAIGGVAGGLLGLIGAS
jgi:hypothetical protein